MKASINSISIEKIQLFLLKLFIIVLPYHYMVICVLCKNISILKYWKEATIILMFALDIISHIQKKKKYEISKVDIINIIFIIVLFIYIIASNNKYASIYIARVYFLPMLLLPVVSHMQIDKTQFKKILFILTINSIILSLWGIIQSVFLGDKFLISIGYEHYFNASLECERLHPSFYIFGITKFQRLTSTFVSPNTCAMYLSVIFTLILYFHKKLEMDKKLSYISMGIIIIAIVLSFSRTAWIACAVSIFIYFIKHVKITKETLKSMLIRGICIIIIALLIDVLLLDRTIINIGSHLIYNTINLKDSSLQGHITSLKNSLELFSNNILGLGLGNNGSRAISIFGEDNINLTESSYFLMLYEVGIIGAFVYFGSYIEAIIENKRIRKEFGCKEIFGVVVIVIMFLICYLSLPYIQDFELLAMLYITIAIQYNYEYKNRGKVK